jgi:hypothetical protein
MKHALVIATCTLLLASQTRAQPATSSSELLPAAEDLGPGWVELTSTLPTPDPTYPEARGWYPGPDGSRVALLISVPPSDLLAGNWAEFAQGVEDDAPASLLSPEHPSAITPSIAGCSALRRAQGLPASFPVLTEAITACRTPDALLLARVSGTWQGLEGTAASDGLIQLLLAHRSGSSTGTLPAPVTSLAALLPSTSELPPGLELASDGALTVEAMPLTFPEPTEAAERLARWGWQENAYRGFVVAGEQTPGAPSAVEISLHRFASDSGAGSALPYFADARAEVRGLSVVPTESISPDESVVVGQAAEGNEATLFLRLGDVLVRVTAVVPDGPAEYVARQVADAVVAKHNRQTAE